MKYQNLKDSLGHVLDEHLSRTNLIHKAILFPVNAPEQDFFYENAPLSDLYKILEGGDASLSIQSLERVFEIKLALQKISQSVVQQLRNGTLQEALYNEYLNLSSEFIGRLLRFEQDFSQEGNGIDPLTGLRSNNAIIDDLARELSACARRGDYIGVAVGCIDSFVDIRGKLNKEQKERLLIFIADALKQTMRVYDDGYRYKEDMFVICFKHTDHLGAISAIERFIRLIREAHNSQQGKDIRNIIGHDITLSYSVAKLEVGANIKDFLKQLENDVKNNADDDSTILEYRDVSDLERFAKEIES